MQYPFGALTRNLRLIKLRKFRGQRPAEPAGDGKTLVVLAKCSMSLNGHLLRPVDISPLASLSQDSQWRINLLRRPGYDPCSQYEKYQVITLFSML